MASVKVCLCLIISLFNLVCGNVPVLLWESSSSDRVNSFPALHRLRSNDFQQYILKKVHGEQPVPLIVLFSEESLSIEDFSWQDSQGQGYFPQLKYITDNAANDEFLPSVQDPIEAAKKLSEFGFSLKEIDSSKTTELPDGCGKILVVKLDEAKPVEDRPDLLRRHDLRIAEVYSQLLSKCSHVIGLLSGQQSSWVEPEEVTRVRRASNDTDVESSPAVSPNVNYTLYEDLAKGLALVYSSTKPELIYDGKMPAVVLGSTSQYFVTTDKSKEKMIKLFAKYGSEYRLTFNFDHKTDGYWYLQSIDLQVGGGSNETNLKSSTEIFAPIDKSWHTPSSVVFKNGSTTLKFMDLQVQPFFVSSGSNTKLRFAVADDTVEFFTPAIWSGLFVTFLLAIIFSWGITMLMDIKTMDQFDDPKGKTITVTASD